MQIFGIDDGHSSIKLVNGQEINIPSKVIAGRHKGIDIFTGENNNFIYTVDGKSYTVSKENNEGSLDTRTEDFPVSNMNLVLVNHVLDQSSASGDISICTGLPFNRYYKDSVVNKSLIEDKKTSFRRNIKGTHNSFSIVNHFICSEAVAGYFDLILNSDGSDNQYVTDMIGDGSVVIIDIGGRTTDIVTIKNQQINFSSSTTIDIGCLQVEDELRRQISLKTNVVNVPNEVISKTISNNGIYKTPKHALDFSDLLSSSKYALAEQILNKVRQIVPQTLNTSLIAFIGGGSIILSDELNSIFPSEYTKFVSNPIFSNARGMKKLLTKQLNSEG